MEEGRSLGSHGSTFGCRSGAQRSCDWSGWSSDDSLLVDAHRTLSTNAVAFSGGSGLKTRGRTAAVFGCESASLVFLAVSTLACAGLRRRLTCCLFSMMANASAISFWLTPHRFATFFWHLWWTFMLHSAAKTQHSNTHLRYRKC